MIKQSSTDLAFMF